MPAERTAEVTFPKVFPQCANCEFAKRAAEVGSKQFVSAPIITMECWLSGGGGATQVKPGKFVEYKSRYLIVTSGTDKRNERLEGFVPICPVDKSDSPQEYPDHPHFEHLGKDLFGAGFRRVLSRNTESVQNK